MYNQFQNDAFIDLCFQLKTLNLIPKTNLFMKKLNYLFVALLAATTVFTSCDQETDGLGPVLEVILTNENPTYEVGEVLNYSITATSADVLGDLTVEQKIGDGEYEDTPNGSYPFFEELEEVVAFAYTIPEVDGGTVIELVFNASDEDGNSDKTETITVASGAITEFVEYTMGGQNSATLGSYLDLTGGKVMLQLAARTASADIDLVYYYGATGKASLYAPGDAVAIADLSSLDLQSFAVQNKTMLALSTTLDFATVTVDEVTAAADAATTTSVTTLAVDSVVVFKTVGGEHGVLQVSAVTGDGAGSITFDVKMVATAAVKRAFLN